MSTVQTRSELADALFARLTDSWNANAPAGAKLFYEGVGGESNLDVWGFASIQHSFAERTTLGPSGKNMFTNRRYGTMYVQVFGPGGRAIHTIGDLADDLCLTFETTPVGFPVRVTETSVQEIGVTPDGAHFQINVIVGFSYDRVV